MGFQCDNGVASPQHSSRGAAVRSARYRTTFEVSADSTRNTGVDLPNSMSYGPNSYSEHDLLYSNEHGLSYENTVCRGDKSRVLMRRKPCNILSKSIIRIWSRKVPVVSIIEKLLQHPRSKL